MISCSTYWFLADIPSIAKASREPLLIHQPRAHEARAGPITPGIQGFAIALLLQCSNFQPFRRPARGEWISKINPFIKNVIMQDPGSFAPSPICARMRQGLTHHYRCRCDIARPDPQSFLLIRRIAVFKRAGSAHSIFMVRTAAASWHLRARQHARLRRPSQQFPTSS